MIEAAWHGQVEYLTALTQQKDQVSRKKADQSLPDHLMLLEHPPTYTLGSSGKEEHLLLTNAELREEGIVCHKINRGGDITYHGPGQLVGYPILDLKRLYAMRGVDQVRLHGYVRDLEEVIIQALALFEIEGWRYPGYTGVWVGDQGNHPRKIAAIGIHVSSRWISSHGFALNVNPNMTHFNHIIPCGIQEHGVTSMTEELDHPVPVTDLIGPIIESFQNVFNVEISRRNDYVFNRY